jgi:nitrous oxidase accessory protein NosD
VAKPTSLSSPARSPRALVARLNLVNTKIACLSLAYGWINRITDCLFAQCMGVGLHLWNQANNADIQNNNFYGNSLPLVVEQAAQVLIAGNVIEGNQGPGIVASHVEGLTISANCE